MDDSQFSFLPPGLRAQFNTLVLSARYNTLINRWQSSTNQGILALCPSTGYRDTATYKRPAVASLCKLIDHIRKSKQSPRRESERDDGANSPPQSPLPVLVKHTRRLDLRKTRRQFWMNQPDNDVQRLIGRKPPLPDSYGEPGQEFNGISDDLVASHGR